MADLTHFDERGASRMVDIGEKPITTRVAVAEACITMQPETLQLIRDRKFAKGDVFEVARLAGIMASKRTAELIPLCHPLGLDSATIDFDIRDERTVRILATTKISSRTGVEMEALTSASIAALTIYDMCKAVDREMVIGPIQLLEKRGGKSGDFQRNTDNEPR